MVAGREAETSAYGGGAFGGDGHVVLLSVAAQFHAARLAVVTLVHEGYLEAFQAVAVELFQAEAVQQQL